LLVKNSPPYDFGGNERIFDSNYNSGISSLIESIILVRHFCNESLSENDKSEKYCEKYFFCPENTKNTPKYFMCSLKLSHHIGCHRGRGDMSGKVARVSDRRKSDLHKIYPLVHQSGQTSLQFDGMSCVAKYTTNHKLRVIINKI